MEKSKFKCCDYLLHEIVFAQSEVIPCCCAPKHKYETRFFSNYNGEIFDVNEYIKTKNQYIQMFKDGNIPDCCKGCHCIHEDNWDLTNEVKRIIITNRTKCSCNCIYCSLITTSTQTKEELNKRKAYDVLPVLKDMRTKNLIKETCEILIAGGECCEYPKGELEEIIYITSIINCKLEILSSGILYSKAIENALKSQKCTLKISVDSGIKKTYEKIKRIKSYDKVWQNLKNYILASTQNNDSKVIIKYIIIPGINDNIREIKSFIKKSNDINCKNIEIALEYNWYDKNKNKPIPTSIKKIVQYIKQQPFNITYEGNCIEYFKYL